MELHFLVCTQKTLGAVDFTGFSEKVIGKKRNTDLHYNNLRKRCVSYVFNISERDFSYLCIECIIFLRDTSGIEYF